MFRIYKFVEDDNEENQTSELDDDTEEADVDSSFDVEDDEEFSDELEEEEDEDFQGVIRTVPGACLVYKRRDEQNTYEELWVYNVGGRDIKPEMKIRNSILAGTDIDPKTQRSEDGQQTCETITTGNVQFLHIKGLLN